MTPRWRIPRDKTATYLNDARWTGRIIVDPNLSCEQSDLFADYMKWCIHYGTEPSMPCYFSRHLTTLGYPKGRGPVTMNGRKGLGLVRPR